MAVLGHVTSRVGWILKTERQTEEDNCPFVSNSPTSPWPWRRKTGVRWGGGDLPPLGRAGKAAEGGGSRRPHQVALLYQPKSSKSVQLLHLPH